MHKMRLLCSSDPPSRILIEGLVPYTAGPVMRHLYAARLLSLLHCVVQEEIYQNGIDTALRMTSNNVSTYQLYTPYATAYMRC
jgi:hypothetical protein